MTWGVPAAVMPLHMRCRYQELQAISEGSGSASGPGSGSRPGSGSCSEHPPHHSPAGAGPCSAAWARTPTQSHSAMGCQEAGSSSGGTGSSGVTVSSRVGSGSPPLSAVVAAASAPTTPFANRLEATLSPFAFEQPGVALGPGRERDVRVRMGRGGGRGGVEADNRKEYKVHGGGGGGKLRRHCSCADVRRVQDVCSSDGRPIQSKVGAGVMGVGGRR